MKRAQSAGKSKPVRKVPDTTPFPKGLSAQIRRSLASAGYQFLEELADVPESKLACLHGMTPAAVELLRGGLARLGLALGHSDLSESTTAPGYFPDLWSDQATTQGAAFQRISAETMQRVSWAYEVWDEVVRRLKDPNNRSRSIAAQLLCNLAKSDPEERIVRDFSKLFAVTGDAMFVTARHCLLALWKIGCVGEKQQKTVVKALEKWFKECTSHKNCTLIRYDIIQGFRNLYDVTRESDLRIRALALIELEDNAKYKKKYLTLWPKTLS